MKAPKLEACRGLRVSRFEGLGYIGFSGFFLYIGFRVERDVHGLWSYIGIVEKKMEATI